jgi:N-acetylglucosamine-6-phosphate deacetylase
VIVPHADGANLRILGGTNAAGIASDVTIIDGIQSTNQLDGRYLDATGLTVAPGFIDLQINGAYGWDFTTDPESIWTVGAQLPSTGVTSFCPTIITAPPERTEVARAAIAARPDGYVGASPLGLHLEGPHLAPSRRGTHPEHLLRDPGSDQPPTDGVAIVTIAPELPGAIERIRHLTNEGVVVSIGHSAASTAEALAALDAGATFGTHVFNAMPPITGREPGIVGALLTDRRSHFGLICDGQHLDPTTIRLAWMAAADRLVLITDAIEATGMPQGRYRIGDVDVTVEGSAVRNEAGALAGAVTTLDTALRMFAAIIDEDLATVLPVVTTHPAAVVRQPDIGAVQPGTRGDIVLLDGFTVVATVIGGQVAHLSERGRLVAG